ncbi:H-type small acid-soluble spore protein [Salipaludibacillus sp. CUR1]|uniref:H-type small acid-soluble spore protein n=1 Tax=Salipaludibacillus sp. CUR1 TaxID=2820003 RepID=UPI001E5C61B4|nr:H-type small acid-soluble spore protein [Salipaludibacillus sp. CUR1]MCE7791111.1 H-type small acid-soluble spore protein [Salipaludibacillus sp. CUR1]
MLDRHRAEEIAASPDMKHVLYKGRPVYIQHVHKDGQTARIFTTDNPENEFEVPVSSLIEKN